jgi:alpha/beta superfamily hydrolase
MGVIQQRREVSFECDGNKLEGLLHLPDDTNAEMLPGVVVAHPHPQYGGDMYNNVVQAVCEAALAAGCAALRFNFRGVGFSGGEYDNGEGEQRDIAAALDYLRELPEVDGERVALCGYSFGAAVALRASPPGLRAIVAVSPPTVGGWLTQPSVTCPLLIVAGDRDEYANVEALHEFATSTNGLAEVDIMRGVDHFWWGSDDRLRECVRPFLTKHLL